MKLVIQRVSEASVSISGKVKSSIGPGLLVLLGIAVNDTVEDISWLTRKLSELRVFNDKEGVMNISIKDSGGDILVISQFTLLATTKKGNRPSYINAAGADHAIPLYQTFLSTLETICGKPVYSGEFGADMQVRLLNDGPVTILIDSQRRD